MHHHKVTFYEETWRPEQRNIGYSTTTELTQGTLFILNRQPVRLWEIREIPLDRWPTKYLETWEAERAHTTHPRTRTSPSSLPHEWRRRPIGITTIPDTGPTLPTTPTQKPLHYIVTADRQWRTLPDHYAVCRWCQEIPPCRHVHNERVGKLHTQALNQRLSLMPGCCHHCHEPITSRQKTITFPGDNLLRPDFPPNSVIFHARTTCRAGALTYDHKWAAATGQPHRWHCTGTATWHANKQMTCTEDPHCTGPHAQHTAALYHHAGHANCWCTTPPGTPNTTTNA